MCIVSCSSSCQFFVCLYIPYRQCDVNFTCAFPQRVVHRCDPRSKSTLIAIIPYGCHFNKYNSNECGGNTNVTINLEKNLDASYVFSRARVRLACSEFLFTIYNQLSISWPVEVVGKHWVSIWNRLIVLYRLTVVLKSNIDFCQMIQLNRPLQSESKIDDNEPPNSIEWNWIHNDHSQSWLLWNPPKSDNLKLSWFKLRAQYW